MTLQEFLEKLEQTPRTWRITREGEIMCGAQCPISALTGHHSARFATAAKQLDLDSSLAFSIAKAADFDKGHDPELRAQLLKACGLA